MDEFFRTRDERIARILEHETPTQRTTRLSRKAQPPTESARVFEWTQSGSGEYTYEEILKTRRQGTLDYYSEEQSRYDPVLNEWHCCELWGDFSDEDDGFPYFPVFEGDNRPAEDAVAPPTSNLPIDDSPVEEFLLPNPDDARQQQPLNIRLYRLQGEILTVARLYFGYTPQIPPVPDVPVVTDEKRHKSFCRSFGLIWDQVKSVDEVFAIQPVAAAIDFFIRLAKNSPLLADEWDLILDNPFSVSRSPRFTQFRPLQTKSGLQTKEVTTYMLDLGTKSTAPWKLAMKSALDALVVCRLDPAFNEYNIVDFLLTNGIPFHTLQPSSSVSRALQVQCASLSPYRRPHNYDFGSRDYLAYRQRCHSILSHPRGRAALMHGHFMWRIALCSVRWEAVYNGPSGWSQNPDEILVVQDPSTGIEYLNDKLSLDEQDALCGTYHCLSLFASGFASEPER